MQVHPLRCARLLRCGLQQAECRPETPGRTQMRCGRETFGGRVPKCIGCRECRSGALRLANASCQRPCSSSTAASRRCASPRRSRSLSRWRPSATSRHTVAAAPRSPASSVQRARRSRLSSLDRSSSPPAIVPAPAGKRVPRRGRRAARRIPRRLPPTPPAPDQAAGPVPSAQRRQRARRGRWSTVAPPHCAV